MYVSYEHHIRIIWKLWYNSYMIEFSYDSYIISTWLWKELHIRIIRSKIASIAFDYLSVCPFVRLFVNFSHFHLPQPLGQFQQHFAQIFRWRGLRFRHTKANMLFSNGDYEIIETYWKCIDGFWTELSIKNH